MDFSVKPEELRAASIYLQRSTEQLYELVGNLNRLLYSASHEQESTWLQVGSTWEQARHLSEQVRLELYRLGENLKLRSSFVEESFGTGSGQLATYIAKRSTVHHALRQGSESLILPAARFSPGIISNPKLAVDVVCRQKGTLRPLTEDLPLATSSKMSLTDGDAVVATANPSSMLSISMMSSKRSTTRTILKEAALNPQSWSFKNPASGL